MAGIMKHEHSARQAESTKESKAERNDFFFPSNPLLFQSPTLSLATQKDVRGVKGLTPPLPFFGAMREAY